jgi:hypothetical protein
MNMASPATEAKRSFLNNCFYLTGAKRKVKLQARRRHSPPQDEYGITSY